VSVSLNEGWLHYSTVGYQDSISGIFSSRVKGNLTDDPYPLGGQTRFSFRKTGRCFCEKSATNQSCEAFEG
jgi:hypothetical protein